MSEPGPSKSTVAVGVLLAVAGMCLWLWGLVALLAGLRSQPEIFKAVAALHVGLAVLCVGVLLARYGGRHAASLPWGAARQWRFVPDKPEQAPHDPKPPAS